MKRIVAIAGFSFFCLIGLFAQKTIIEGKVVNLINNEPLPFATVRVVNYDSGVIADSVGIYRIELPAGLYNLEASYTGYSTVVKHEIQTQSSKPVVVNFEMSMNGNDLEEAVVTAEAYRNTAESPLALQRINLHELRQMPGATLDASKFIKTLPGVSPKVSFGYNLIVRGGSSNENRFYLDGMEIPSITHFTVQGTSGGP
ncbi:MAG: TonB-dependent receptor, partial [Bacteroidetes bacterium]